MSFARYLGAAALVALALAVPPTIAENAARVEAFSPQGEVKAVRQVVARFSEPMVTFGDPRTESPFDIDCPAKGTGHWADTRNWIYDFEQDLPAGLNCRFKVRDKITTHAGGPVMPASFAFTTGGPAVRNTWPHEGNEEIDEQQVFLLGLDAPADPKTIKGNAYCMVGGVGERIGLDVIEGAERDKIIAEQQDEARYFFSVLTKRGRLGTLAVKDNSLKDAPLVVARCARRLPPGAEVSIVWGKGIRTASGVPTSENQTLAYQVREDFVVKQSCMRMKEDAGCTPVLPVRLSFSAPVSRELAQKITFKTSNGTQKPDPINEHEKTVDSVSFAGPFPANSDATVTLPSKFVDDSGRAPTNAASFPLKVRIDDDPPLVKFPSRFGILEANAEPMLPVTVRNVEATLKGLSVQMPTTATERPASGRMARIDTSDDRVLAQWLARILEGPNRGNSPEGTEPLLSKSDGGQPITLPRTGGDRPFEVIGIPLPKPGFYAVEFASDRLGAALFEKKAPYYVYSSALVTNMAVHFKHGRESSLVWVTQLDNAQPVAGAKVRISDCTGEKEWEGTTDAQGVAKVPVEIPRYSRWEQCRYASSAHIVSARKGDDMSFMLSTWRDGIERWQFNLGSGETAGPILAHTVLDRPLFRAGETVSMKHFVRTHTSTGFGELKDLPAQVTIEHMGSGETYTFPLTWNHGVAQSSWVIPKEADLGSYQIYLGTPRGRMLESGSFRVEQFRVPLMHAQLKPPATPTVGGGKVDIDAQLSYLAGGPAAGQTVKFRSRLEPYVFSFSAYDDFSFGGRKPKEGISATEPYSYDPDADDEDDETDGASDTDTGPSQSRYPVKTQTVSLDASGGARVTFDGLPKVDDPQALAVEMEYSDPNGQILTAATRALVLPSKLVLGMHMDSYFATRDRLAFKVLAVDAAGKPQAGRKVVVDAYTRITYAYRKRLLGGFYSYEQTQEVKNTGAICKGDTDARGLVICDGDAPATGELILVARADDDGGNTAIASQDTYVAGADDWFDAGSSDRIDVLPDKRAYEPGDTARFEVRMPFREATALVTVEREGVLTSHVQQISAKSPFVDVAIADNYGPNAYVSVMVVRGRVDPEQPGSFAWLKRMVYRIGMFFGIVKEMPREVDTRPTATVDLTKPAFKLGMVPIRVGWKAYELKVNVQPERSTYKVRDKAAVRITVTDADGKPAANGEVALAAVDEGLLALSPPTSWNLLEAMMQRRPDEVDTSTAQSQVIGKRHFGKKAVAAGGDGGGSGGSNARELFDTLLLWQGTVKLDANGSARVEVPLNDSLTSFRIEAIAHAGIQKFGSGGASINTTQDVMLFAGLPPFVREGDKFAAMVTVRNGGERALNLDVTAQYAPAGMQDGKTAAATPAQPAPQKVSLQPGEAKTLSFAATAPVNATRLDWSVTAQEAGGAARDALKVSQNVGAAYPVRVYQQTLEQLETGKPLSFPVQIPAGAVPGRGGVDVRLAKSLGGDFTAVRDWVSRYPYICLEQQTSVAVALEDESRWSSIADTLPVYLDRDGLARYFPTPLLQGDDMLTAYILAISNEADWDVPEDSRDRMIKGLKDFVAGRVVRYSALPTADLAMRKLAAIEALSRYGEAKASMLQSIEIAPNLWPSSAVLDWMSILSRMQDIPDREQKLADARQILRSRLMFSGTTLNFSTEKSDYLWWLMVSPDLNAVRALRLLADDPSFAADMPRLARGALGRQQAGHWRTTNANAWGVLALRRFQQRFERDPVGGITNVALGNNKQALNWAQAQSRNTGDPTQGTPIGDGVDAHFGWPAGTAQMSLAHDGSGKPWAFIASRAALPLDKPLFAGYQVKRTITPVEQKKSGVWSRGDVYRVTIDVDAQSDMTWVVINDPIPAGATILGSGLGGDSSQLTAGEKAQGWVRPAFEERAFEGFRAYYRYLPKGKVQLQYTVRLNNVGNFEMPATRVEALYAPEVFGELPVAKMEVREP